MSSKEPFNPFPGLRAFEEDEDHLFFGREKQVDDLLKKLRTRRFITVTGASGSGKSSLVKCGLIPALHSGYMTTAGSHWHVAVFRPGDDPIGNLARVLAQPGVLYDDDTDPEARGYPMIEATLRRSNLGLTEAVRQSGLNTNLLLVIDQFEELFRFSRYERNKYSERRDSLTFADLVLNAIRQQEIPLYIILTMRSDFLGDCTGFAGLPEAINHGQYLVPRMSRDERREAISGPVAVGGASITPRLLTHLLNDVGDNPDQLPILQHALLRTWRYWEQNHALQEPLDLKHYEAIGTMSHALSQHAEEAYLGLSSDRSRKICEVLFKAITDKAEERQGIRRPTKLKEICLIGEATLEEVTQVIDAFRKEGRSFLMPPDEVALSEESIIDISHESLMRIWERLIKWVEEETQGAGIYKRLAEAAALYQEAKTGLWRNPELQFALKWYEESKPNRHWAQRYDPAFERAVGFLKESKRQEVFEILQRQKQEKLKIRRIRFFAIFLGTAAIVSILLLIVALNLRIEAEHNATLALEQAAEANRQRSIADKEKREAKLQSEEAKAQRQKAEDLQQVAEAEKRTAEHQRQRAEINALNAFIQQQAAINAKTDAEEQKRIALDQKQIAEHLQVQAQSSEKRISKLRLLALSRTLAFQALREQRNNSELSALLALHAYRFNLDNGGYPFDPDIYNALALAAGNKLTFAGHDESIRAVTISSDGQKIISGADDRTVRIWNIRDTGKPPIVFTHAAAPIRSVACTADAQYLLAGDINGNVMAWDLLERDSHTPTVVKAHAASVNALIAGKKNGWIISGGADGVISMLTPAAPTTPALVIDRIPARITSLALAADGRSLAVASEEQRVRIYNLDQQKSPPLILQAQRSRIRSVCFSHDGKYLAGGGYDGTVLLWNLSNKDPLAATLTGHDAAINSLAFSAGDQLLASASADGTLRLWDHKNHDQEPVVLNGHTGWVWSLAFTPDGRGMVSAGEDKKIRLWTPDINVLAAEACKRVTRDLTHQEWNNYIGDNVPYEKSCGNF